MPCDMMSGATSGDFARASVEDLRRSHVDLVKKVAMMEEAMCAMTRMLRDHGLTLYPEVDRWFRKHVRSPGCGANEGGGQG